MLTNVTLQKNRCICEEVAFNVKPYTYTLPRCM